MQITAYMSWQEALDRFGEKKVKMAVDLGSAPLKTGAKLYPTHDNDPTRKNSYDFVVRGYAADGSDVVGLFAPKQAT